MSLDIYLYEKDCPHCGRAPEMHCQNITHNLNKMADALGIYQLLWHPGDHPDAPITASRLIDPLKVAIKKMLNDPDKYKQYDAENGWGTYVQFLPWLKKLLSACKEQPNAIIRVSR